MTHKTDAELLRDWRECRDEAAFGQLVARHGALVQSVARRRLYDTDSAPDIAVRAFALLAQRPERAPAAHLAGWLVKVTQHLSDTDNRSRQRRLARERRAMANLPLTETDMTPQSSELGDRIDATLATLKPDERECLLLHYAEGLSHRQVGDRLGISEDASRMRISRALERARKRLGLSASATVAGLEKHRAPSLSPSEITHLTQGALRAPALTSGSLGLGWILMTTTQKLIVAGAALLVLSLSVTGGVMASNHLSPPQRAKPLVKMDYGVFAGNFRGTLTYVVRKTGRKVKLNTWGSVRAQPNGLIMRGNYDASDWNIETNVTINDVQSEMITVEKGQRSVYKLVALEPGRIVATRHVDEPGRPREERYTVSRQGNELSVLIEEQLNGKDWLFANEHRGELTR